MFLLKEKLTFLNKHKVFIKGKKVICFHLRLYIFSNGIYKYLGTKCLKVENMLFKQSDFIKNIITKFGKLDKHYSKYRESEGGKI